LKLKTNKIRNSSNVEAEEMVHKKDVESCIKLYVEILKSISPEWIDSIKNPKI